MNFFGSLHSSSLPPSLCICSLLLLHSVFVCQHGVVDAFKIKLSKKLFDQAHVDGEHNQNDLLQPLDLSELGNINNADAIDVQLVEDGQEQSFKRRRGGERSRSNTWYGEYYDSNAGSEYTLNIVQQYSDSSDVGAIIQTYASINTGSKIFQIVPDINGIHQLIERDTSEFPEEGEPVDMGEPVDFGSTHGRGLLLEDNQSPLRGGKGGKNNAMAATSASDMEIREARALEFTDDDNGDILDVMVLWSGRAECGATPGADKENCTYNNITTNNILGLIDLAIEETNAAFTMSGINTQLRLVHAYRYDSTFQEGDENFNYAHALDEIRQSQSVALEREKYGADIVSMIIEHPSYCGMGHLGPNKASAFSISSRACATGYYSFGHEIGHNLGCRHDRGTQGHCDTEKRGGNNYAYRDPDGEFRSILGYYCKADQCDNLNFTSTSRPRCPRVQRFSNTHELYGDKPIGDEYNNNAKQINSVLKEVAQFFPSKRKDFMEYCSSHGMCDDNDECTIDTCDLIAKTCVHKNLCSISPPSPTPISTTTTTTTSSLQTPPPTRAPDTTPASSPASASPSSPASNSQIPIYCEKDHKCPVGLDCDIRREPKVCTSFLQNAKRTRSKRLCRSFRGGTRNDCG